MKILNQYLTDWLLYKVPFWLSLSDSPELRGTGIVKIQKSKSNSGKLYLITFATLFMIRMLFNSRLRLIIRNRFHFWLYGVYGTIITATKCGYYILCIWDRLGQIQRIDLAHITKALSSCDSFWKSSCGKNHLLKPAC